MGYIYRSEAIPNTVLNFLTWIMFWASTFHCLHDFQKRWKKGARFSLSKQPVMTMLAAFAVAGFILGLAEFDLFLAAFDASIVPSYRGRQILGVIGTAFGYAGCNLFTLIIFSLARLSQRFNLNLGRESARAEQLQKSIFWVLGLANLEQFAQILYLASFPQHSGESSSNFEQRLAAGRLYFFFILLALTVPLAALNLYFARTVISDMEVNMSRLEKPLDVNAASTHGPTTTAPTRGTQLSNWRPSTRVRTNATSATTGNTQLKDLIRRLRIASMILSLGVYFYFGFGQMVLRLIFDQAFDFRNYTADNHYSVQIAANIVMLVLFEWPNIVFINLIVFYCRNDTKKINANNTARSNAATSNFSPSHMTKGQTGTEKPLNQTTTSMMTESNVIASVIAQDDEPENLEPMVTIVTPGEPPKATAAPTFETKLAALNMPTPLPSLGNLAAPPALAPSEAGARLPPSSFMTTSLAALEGVSSSMVDASASLNPDASRNQL